MSVNPRTLWTLITHLFVVPCIFLVLFVQCDASVISPVRTNQVLPQACYSNDCPIRAEYYPPDWGMWGKLNKTCCSGFPGTHLHCQRNESSNFPACLPDRLVSGGNTVQLIKDNEGNPQLTTVACDSLTFEPTNRVSSNVTFPYCRYHKSVCREEGQELLCHGGSTADNRCTCQVGYEPWGGGHCASFTDQDVCFCQPLTCPDGQVPTRWPLTQAGPCSVLEKEPPPRFSCAPPRGPRDSSETTHIIVTVTQQPSLNTTDNSGSHPKADDGIGLRLLYAFFALILVIVVVLILVVGAATCRMESGIPYQLVH